MFWIKKSLIVSGRHVFALLLFITDGIFGSSSLNTPLFMSQAIFTVEVLNDCLPPLYTRGVYKCYAACSGRVKPDSTDRIPLGVRVKCLPSHFVRIVGTSIKTLGGVGDSDYRGEMMAIVKSGEGGYEYEKGDEICEMIVMRISDETNMTVIQ